jgi:hypothetical protein
MNYSNINSARQLHLGLLYLSYMLIASHPHSKTGALMFKARSLWLLPVLSLPALLCAQTRPPAAQTQAAQPPQPPATKMEAFQPAAGSVVTFGYDNLGGNVFGISVDVREMRDSKGADARGLLVEVTESEYRKESSFVDMDEIPELLKGFDALMQVSANPTQFKNFEVRYTTRGGLRLTAFNDNRGKLMYAIEVGQYTKAQKLPLTVAQMQALRSEFDVGLQKLSSLGK